MSTALRPRPVNPDRERWLRAAEAASYLGLSVEALYLAVRRGEVPACRLGRRRLRFRFADLERALKAVA